ncbi:AAA family ATPase [Mariniphaga sp.]|uniref:AAA family ATPase n=1 Tax=Mariniphaga sp. TaxID=1954475 RepID=UPI003561AA30
MTQNAYIKEIVRYGLENDQENLLAVLNQLIEHSRKSKRINFALQLQSILKEGLKHQQTKGLAKVGSQKFLLKEEERIIDELVIDKLTSDYTLENLISNKTVREELQYFLKEHHSIHVLEDFSLPVSNKILFYGPSGCGKTLASYVVAGELEKLIYVINLGAIVSSKLGETSKNISTIFKKAATEDSIIFLDEFDSLGKVRDYNQDHGEMKRVVNTILQLFDYLPQETIVIAATNQVNMIDEALLRRFDLKLKLELPNKTQIRELIKLTLQNTPFKIDDKKRLTRIVGLLEGQSYYFAQKTLINAIKRTLFSLEHKKDVSLNVDLCIWEEIIKTSN